MASPIRTQNSHDGTNQHVCHQPNSKQIPGSLMSRSPLSPLGVPRYQFVYVIDSIHTLFHLAPCPELVLIQRAGHLFYELLEPEKVSACRSLELLTCQVLSSLSSKPGGP